MHIKIGAKTNSRQDSAAVELLYKRWASILKNYANYFLNDEEVSSTIVNDIFIKIWNLDHQIEDIRAYLFKSVKNAAFNYLSSKYKKPVSYLDADQLVLISDAAQPHEVLVEESDQLVYLQKLISRLPKKRQLVFRMHRIEGFSYAEISELLQISPRTVEDHLAKSMKFIYENCHQFFNLPLTEA